MSNLFQDLVHTGYTTSGPSVQQHGTSACHGQLHVFDHLAATHFDRQKHPECLSRVADLLGRKRPQGDRTNQPDVNPFFTSFIYGGPRNPSGDAIGDDHDFRVIDPVFFQEDFIVFDLPVLGLELVVGSCRGSNSDYRRWSG